MESQLEQLELPVLDSSWVEPATPVEPSFTECSTLDNLTAPCYPSPVEFFPLQPGHDPRAIYEDVRRGLARCLHQYPHLGGILRKDDSGRHAIEIRPAPYAGTNFKFQDLRNDMNMPTYEEFRAAGFPFADGDLDGLSALRMDPFPCGEDGEPIVAPQFNAIRGGIIITFSIAHHIGDLVQFKNFVAAIARQTGALAEARAAGLPEPPLPERTPAHLLDRSRMRPNVPIEEDLDKLAARAAKIPHFQMLDPRDAEKMGEMLTEIFTKARLTHKDLERSSEDDLRELSCSVWAFTLPAIKQIQAMAIQAAPPGTKLSSMDCLAAFTWQRFFLAKWAPDQEGPTPAPKETRCVFAGSVRHRLTPAIPNEYLPACVDLFPVMVKTSDIAASTPETLAKAAMMVRNSSNNWNEKTFREMLEIAESHPMSPGLVPTGPMDVLITDHTRGSGPDALINWGPALGQCEAVREPYLGRVPPHGEVTILPRWKNGMAEVMIAGEVIVMERLKKDPLLNRLGRHEFTMHDFAAATAKKNSKSKL